MMLIDKDKLIKGFEEECVGECGCCRHSIRGTGECGFIANFPSEIELVRCKDCKHWYFADNRIPSEQENVCGRNGIVVTPEWFCADGERKEML